MKRVQTLLVIVLSLTLLPMDGGDISAALAVAETSSHAMVAADRSTRPSDTVMSVMDAEPTTTVGKFGASFVTGGMGPPNRATAAALANEAGLAWAREDIHWSLLEMSPGNYVWTDRDDVINKLAAQNIQIIGNILYTPPFYSSNPGAPNPHAFPPTSPAALNAYSTFVSMAVNRYKDRVHHWQVWGSTADPGVYGLAPGGLNEYFALATRAHAAIKAADPNATVVMASASPTFLNQFLDAGGGNLVDIFSMSSYPIFDNPPSNVTPIPEASRLTNWHMALMRDVIQRRAPSKPLWVSEYDWASVPPHRAAISEADQAAFQIRSLLLQEAQPNIGRVLWGFYTDDTIANFGMLVRLNLAKKASFDAFKAMTTVLAGATYAQTVPSPSTSTQTIENFEGSQTYVATTFGTATGGYSKSSANPHSGAQSGKIDYSWTSANGSGVNVLPIPGGISASGSPKRFKMWARGDGGPGVTVGITFTDATNRFCSGLVGLVAGTEWREYTLYLDPPNGQSSIVVCNGQDGVTINYPIVFNGFSISGSNHAAPSDSGSLYVDDLAFESGPSIFDLVYSVPGGQVHAVWTLSGTATLPINVNVPSVTVRDWRNAIQTINAVSGVVNIPASVHPVFVTIPLVTANCSVRPQIVVSTTRVTAGQLRSTIQVQNSTTVTSNQLVSIQVEDARNARINLGTRTNMSGNFTESFGANTTQTTMTFSPAETGKAVQIPMKVRDLCGEWKTFVGGGTQAF